MTAPTGEVDRSYTRGVERAVIDDLTVRVAALDDVIASKRAANRPKDRMVLPCLESLREHVG